MLYPDIKAFPRFASHLNQDTAAPPNQKGSRNQRRSQLLMWLEEGGGMRKEGKRPNQFQRLSSTDETEDIPDTVLALGQSPQLKARGGGGDV